MNFSVLIETKSMLRKKRLGGVQGLVISSQNLSIQSYKLSIY